MSLGADRAVSPKAVSILSQMNAHSAFGAAAQLIVRQIIRERNKYRNLIHEKKTSYVNITGTLPYSRY